MSITWDYGGLEMWMTEEILFNLARALYHSEVAHSTEMKEALVDIDAYDSFRSHEIERITKAAAKYHVDIAEKTILDLGCNDGAVSAQYLCHGARNVFGVDIDRAAIERAKSKYTDQRLTFIRSTPSTIPLTDHSIDVALSYDVFEHVAEPLKMLNELMRILTPGGKALIGTWSWLHPYAPHLWSVMPVPWSHVFFTERTLLKVCRRVYESRWYVPNMHDFDDNGKKLPTKYINDSISKDYLNKYLIRDYERDMRAAGFQVTTNTVPFGSRYARMSSAFVDTPGLREFLSGYVWFVLVKPEQRRCRDC